MDVRGRWRVAKRDGHGLAMGANYCFCILQQCLSERQRTVPSGGRCTGRKSSHANTRGVPPSQ